MATPGEGRWRVVGDNMGWSWAAEMGGHEMVTGDEEVTGEVTAVTGEVMEVIRFLHQKHQKYTKIKKYNMYITN